MDVKSYIVDWVDAHSSEMVADIGRLVAVKSVKGEPESGMPFGPGPAKALEMALAVCDRYGFATRNYENYVGTADMNDKETVLDILGHLDVVGEGEGWETDPYTAMEQDGRLYGRGTDDDKGPVVAALYAMRAIQESGLPLKYNVRLIMGTDEESGSDDLRYYFSKEKSAPNTFSPDSGFPIYNTEKGAYRPIFKKQWEKTDALPRVTLFDGGFRFNVLPADARAVVAGVSKETALTCCEPAAKALGVKLTVSKAEDGVELSVKGTASHAAEPEDGNNGITALIRILLALPLADCPSTLTLRQVDEVLPHGDYLGRALGVAMEDEISGYLTLSFTMMQINETGCEGLFDSRVPVCATKETCKDVVDATLGGLGFTVEGEMQPSHHTPADSPFVQTLLRCYEAYSGRTGECLAMGGGTYVHDIEGGVAFGARMPGYRSNLHGPNENINVQDMLTASKIFAAVIADMCIEN